MTISTEETPVKIYNCNGSTTVFPIPYPYVEADDIEVVHTDADSVETTWTTSAGSGATGYTISGDSVVANTAPSTATTLTITRITDITQAEDLIQGEVFEAESEENAFDKITLILQEFRNVVRNELFADNDDVVIPAYIGAPTFAVLDADSKSDNIALTNGGLTASFTGTAADETAMGARTDISVESGKWYFEMTIDQINSLNILDVGVCSIYHDLDQSMNGGNEGGSDDSDTYSYHGKDGKVYGTGAGSALYGDAFSDDDIIGIAVDMDRWKLFFSINGVWQGSGDPAAGTNAPEKADPIGRQQYYAAFRFWHHSLYTDTIVTFNFGQSPFTYTVPVGYNSGFSSY